MEPGPLRPIRSVLEGEIQTSVAAAFSLVLAPVLSASAFVVVAALTWESVPLIILGGIGTAALTVWLAVGLQRLAVTPGLRAWVRGLAAVGVMTLLLLSLNWVVATARENKVLRGVPVEDPDHDGLQRLVEDASQRMLLLERELTQSRIDLGLSRDREAELARQLSALRSTLDDRQKRQALIRYLSDFGLEFRRHRDTCKTTPPEQYIKKANEMGTVAVKRLQDEGYVNDARRLADGTATGMPTLVSPDCSPFNDNARAHVGITARLFVIDDIVERLGR